jgi:hypothetical protein
MNEEQEFVGRINRIPFSDKKNGLENKIVSKSKVISYVSFIF